MTLKRTLHRQGEALPQRRAPLDVGEQERERSHDFLLLHHPQWSPVIGAPIAMLR